MNFDLLLPQPATPPVLKPRWGTVTATAPLRVKLDGDTSALPVTPTTTVAGLKVNDRVWCVLSGLQLVVLGVHGGQAVPPTVAGSLWGTATVLPDGAWTQIVFTSSQLSGGVALIEGGLQVPADGWYQIVVDAQVGNTGWGTVGELFEVRAMAATGPVAWTAGPFGPWTRLNATATGQLAAGAVVKAYAQIFRAGGTPLVDGSLSITRLGG